MQERLLHSYLLTESVESSPPRKHIPTCTSERRCKEAIYEVRSSRGDRLTSAKVLLTSCILNSQGLNVSQTSRHKSMSRQMSAA